jgi:hypothetical protein
MAAPPMTKKMDMATINSKSVKPEDFFRDGTACEATALRVDRAIMGAPS